MRLAITNLEMKRQVIAVNDKLSLKATVRATSVALAALTMSAGRRSTLRLWTRRATS